MSQEVDRLLARTMAVDPNLDDLNLSSDDSIAFTDIDLADIESLLPKKQLDQPIPANTQHRISSHLNHVHSHSHPHSHSHHARSNDPGIPKFVNVNPHSSNYSNNNSSSNRTTSACSTLYDSDEEILKTLQKNVKENEEEEEIRRNNHRFEVIDEKDHREHHINTAKNRDDHPGHFDTRSLSSLSAQSSTTSNSNQPINHHRHVVSRHSRRSSKNSRKRGSSSNINEMGQVTLTDVRSIQFTGIGRRILEEISSQNTQNLNYLYKNLDRDKDGNLAFQKRTKMNSLPEVPPPVPVDIDDNTQCRRTPENGKNGKKSESQLEDDLLSRLDTSYTPDTDPNQLSDIELSKQLATFNLRRAKFIKKLEDHDRDLKEMERLRRMKEAEMKHDAKALDLLGEKIMKYRQIEAERIAKTSSSRREDSSSSSGFPSRRRTCDSMDSTSTIESATADSGNVSEGGVLRKDTDLEHFHELD